MVSSQDVLHCLKSSGLMPDADTIGADESLFDMGVIDSLGMAILVPALEQRFGVSIPEIDLLPSNFDSINAIASYLNTRQHASANS